MKFNDPIYAIINWLEATVYLLTLTLYHPSWGMDYLVWKHLNNIKRKKSEE